MRQNKEKLKKKKKDKKDKREMRVYLYSFGGRRVNVLIMI
jgi:hypothetical protein